MPVSIDEVTATVDAPAAPSIAGNAGTAPQGAEAEIRIAREQQELLARRSARLAAD